MIDLTDCARIKGVHRGTAHPNEVSNHHAPLTPRSTHSTGLFKRASEGTVMFFNRVLSGEGAIAALADITVDLPRKNYTRR